MPRWTLPRAALAIFLCASACNNDLSEAASTESEGSGIGSLTAATTMQNTSADGTGTTAGTVSGVEGSAGGSTGADTTGAGSTDTGVVETETGSGTETGSATDTGTDTGADTGGIACVDNTACDDFLPCNGVETCEGGFCVAGDPVVCDDGVACTVDACDEDTASCVAIALDSNCDDGTFCNGAETCDAALGCQAGAMIDCTDNIDCTDDSCDETADACAFVADDSQCDDGTFCNGAETCDVALGCQPDDDFTCVDLVACTVDTCDENADACVHAPDDSVCDNDVVCDGAEVCDTVMGCGAGDPVNCGDDGIVCTVDACNELTGMCETTLDNGSCGAGQFCSMLGCIDGVPCIDASTCQDGNACNGAELCVAGPGGSVCSPGTPIDCDDGLSCTVDSCEEPGTCAHAPIDGLCNDGNPCDGVESCAVGLGCVDGADLNCDDGVACTTDVCVTNFGCNYLPSDAACDDGTFCNGAEACDLTAGCQAGTPVVCGSDGIACTADICDETLNGCIHPPNDDLCPCGQECSVALGGCGSDCAIAMCDGHLYGCGDCVDNDGDCDVDDNDSNCFGPCSNNESGLDGLIPGQDNAPCKHDCYFDGNSGSGNDDCYWSHECDPLEPSATTCEYDPNAGIPGYAGNMDCTNALMSQSAQCESYCEVLSPNGCDCFGCCEVDLGNETVTVYLGSKVDGNGESTCSIDVIDDPALCHPCTQVPACLNTCADCEICFGNPGPLPPECGGVQVCADGQALCGQAGQDPCPEGEFCLTGCCQAF